MKRIVTFFMVLGIVLINNFCFAQIQWQKCYGGTGWDEIRDIEQTNDGGYIFIAYTESNDGDIIGKHAGTDIWVVKLNFSGIIIWQKCLGGNGNDDGYCIHQTTDGGYIITGGTTSNNYDVSGNHGDMDVWVVKLNADGNIVWQKCYGGVGMEYARTILQTSDGGYIFGGYTNFNSGDVSGAHDNCGDYWVVKIDAVGHLKWQKCYGGSYGDDGVYAIEQTADGGYIISGTVDSGDGDVTGYYFQGDYWIFKTDTIGNIQWKKCYGGNAPEYNTSMKKTPDGGCIVAGMSSSLDGWVQNNHGNYTGDAWLIKLTYAGTVLWKKCYGGLDYESANSIILLNGGSGGYVFTGYTTSNDGDVSGNHGDNDMWVVEIDVSGNMVAQKCLGGDSTDYGHKVIQTNDGGFIVAGTTASNNGDVSGSHGSYDGWIVKLGSISDIKETESIKGLSVYPNPFNLSTQISLYKNYHKIMLQVFNLQGLLVAQNQYSDCDLIQFNRNNLSNGLYFIKLTLDDKMVETKKIIISD